MELNIPVLPNIILPFGESMPIKYGSALNMISCRMIAKL